jgi:hypothetical protein
MTALSAELEAIGLQLQAAYAGRLRRRRLVRVAAAGAAAVAALAVSAAAATGDLQLDPMKWEVLSGGSVDNGAGQYVHAKSKLDGGPSTFMVEHDAGIDRYRAFLLHERLRAAADSTSPVEVQAEPGSLCTRDELTRIEQSTLDALRANGSPQTATAGDQCRGREYGIEIARRVFTSNEPAADLMPSVE